MKCTNCPYPENTECIGESINECKVTPEQLKRQIEETLKELYEKDKYLIDVKANEVCITSRFWYYFLSRYAEVYGALDIDIEYNRNGEHAKWYIDKDGDKHYAKPDMIIHKRGCNIHNFVCIEFKGYWNQEIEKDGKKLRAFTSDTEYFEYKGILYAYKYAYGLSIKLFPNGACVEWFENGKHKQDCDFIWPGLGTLDE